MRASWTSEEPWRRRTSEESFKSALPRLSVPDDPWPGYSGAAEQGSTYPWFACSLSILAALTSPSLPLEFCGSSVRREFTNWSLENSSRLAYHACACALVSSPGHPGQLFSRSQPRHGRGGPDRHTSVVRQSVFPALPASPVLHVPRRACLKQVCPEPPCQLVNFHSRPLSILRETRRDL